MSKLPAWFTPNSRSWPVSDTTASRSPSHTGGNHTHPGTGSEATGTASVSVTAAPSAVAPIVPTGNTRSFVTAGPSA